MRTIRLALPILIIFSVFGLSTITRAAPLVDPVSPGTTNLIAWWPLDETSGTRYDAHGSNNLTDNNTVGYTTGKQSNAAMFTKANNECLSISDNAGLSAGDVDITYLGWFYIRAGSTQDILNKSSPGYEFEIYLNGSNTIGLYVPGASGEARTGALSTGAWYFFLAWHEATNNLIKIQVNDGTIYQNAITAGIPDNVYPFQIGGNCGSSAYFSDTNIDEVAVYKRVLTADERTWLYNSGNGRAYSELSAPTATPTNTATATATNTATATATNTATATSTPTNTATPTDTPTSTATATETATPTNTSTPTATATSTNTPTPTRTPGNMATAFYDGVITYGDAANVTVTALLCLIVALGLVAWFVISTLQKRHKP